VERLAKLLQLAQESPDSLVKRARVLRGYAEELKGYCNPNTNPASFRLCQAAALPAIEALLLVARDVHPEKEPRKDDLTEVRVAAFEALACICFDQSEAVAAAASAGASQLLLASVVSALQPVTRVQQQQEHLAALQLLQGIAAVVPEAPALKPLLPAVAALTHRNPELLHPAPRAVSFAALEVLLSCSMGRQQRQEVAAALTLQCMRSVIAEAGEEAPLRPFVVGLLCANLCDLDLQEENAAQQSAHFATLADELWRDINFFENLAACLNAALDARPWPPESNAYHRPWKLLNTVVRLVVSGFGRRLLPVVDPLVACLLRVGGPEELIGADEARAARLAVTALLGLSVEDEALSILRATGAALPQALRRLPAQEPGAAELLELLELEAPPEDTAPAMTSMQPEAAEVSEASSYPGL